MKISTESRPELIFLCQKTSFPIQSLGKLETVLAMYGYTLLGQYKPPNEEMFHIPALDNFSIVLVLIVQNLRPNVDDVFGELFNLNLVKAVKGLVRKFPEHEMHIITPRSLDEHIRNFDLIPSPDKEELASLAASNGENFAPPFPVLECISDTNSRTRIDKILFHGNVAVCKTYRSTSLGALKKEISARKVLGEAIPEIVPILDQGPNYIIMPFFESAWKWHEGSLRLFPLVYGEKCLNIMQRIHTAGWFVIDWHPGNFIYLNGGEVVMIDLEAIEPNDKLGRFEDSADILGHVNFPYQNKPINYFNTWQPIIGLSLHSLLYGSSSAKRCLRLLYFFGKTLPLGLIKRIEQLLRKPVRKLLARKQVMRKGRFLVYRF